jgi:AraC-like DNA-binding protein
MSSGREEYQKILFLCSAAEKNPAELCFAFFGPQILLHQLRADEEGSIVDGARLIFVYAAEIPGNLKASLDHFQERYNAPVLVSQRANVQKSAQHVLEFLQGSRDDAAHGGDELSASRTAQMDPGLAPLPSDVGLWSDPLPEVTLEGNSDGGERVVATTDIQDYRAEYACRFVLKNFKQAINRDKMAEMVHLSPGYFSNLFRVEIGMSFSDYLIQVRIDNAKKLLRRFDLSVEEVSKECGFNSLAHFSRTFKDRCGVPPLKYRKTPNPVS